MKLELIAYRRSIPQHLFILRSIRPTQRRREDLIRRATDQILFAAQPATLDERLVHNDIFTATVLDEKDDVAQAIEERLARKGRRERREQFLTEIRCFHVEKP